MIVSFLAENEVVAPHADQKVDAFATFQDISVVRSMLSLAALSGLASFLRFLSREPTSEEEKPAKKKEGD